MTRLVFVIQISLFLRVVTGIAAVCGVILAIFNTAIPGIEWRIGLILTLIAVHYGATFLHVRVKERLLRIRAKKTFRSARVYPPLVKALEHGVLRKKRDIIF
ncbi:hypothetical protein [Streptomyces sp. BK79]|uniref:hypothetical protein n=1 Tax=Streptomyces sp. BK79 TaxID=3350097 RepID=UPI00376F9515